MDARENADDCPFTESSSSSDNEEMPVGNLYPYRFEPVVGQEDSSSDDDNDINRNQPDEQQLQQRLHDLSWCTCGHCSVMPTGKQCVCCKEYEEYVKEMNDVQPSAQCITAHAGFHEVCLSVYALRTAYKAYRQRYGDIQGDLNRRNRYTAYRQLVRWCYNGYLGKEVRVVIPSCAVTKIRQQFPSAQYQGFLPATAADF